MSVLKYNGFLPGHIWARKISVSLGREKTRLNVSSRRTISSLLRPESRYLRSIVGFTLVHRNDLNV